MNDDLNRNARRQGLSDGYYGYAPDPGDFDGAAREAYLAGHAEGRAKNRNGKAW